MESWTKERIEQAKANGISRNTFYKRIYYYGWDVERATTTPVMNRFGNKKNIFSEEEIKRAEENGICYDTLYTRVIRRGMDREEAIVKPVARKKAHGHY